MTFGSIYKIQFPNGKHYIGLTTTSLEQRTKEHNSCAKNGDTKCLYNALRKYNMVDSFELTEIDTADTLEELCEKEILYIQEYNSYYMDRNGYNMTFGGEGTNGYVYTEEDRQRNSKAQKKRFENPEERENLIISQKKYWEKPESIKKHCERMKKRFEDNPELAKEMSESQKKRFENPEEREKHCERMKQRFEDNPTLAKEHSERMKKRFGDNPELKEKMSQLQKEYWDNPESRQLISEKKKKYYQDNPEARQKHSEALKKYYENPEARQKNKDAQKKSYEDNPELKKKILDTKGKNKPFDAFKIDGTFIKTFTYNFEANEYLQNTYNITSNIKIGQVLTGSRKSSAGFVFKYK